MASARTDNFLPMETYVKVLLFECPFRLETIQNGLYFSVSPYKENIASEQLKAVMSVKYFVAFSSLFGDPKLTYVLYSSVANCIKHFGVNLHFSNTYNNYPKVFEKNAIFELKHTIKCSFANLAVSILDQI